jgi:hypothetical protein
MILVKTKNLLWYQHAPYRSRHHLHHEHIRHGYDKQTIVYIPNVDAFVKTPFEPNCT